MTSANLPFRSNTTSQQSMDCDVLIVGAGPAGLSLSIALSQAGMRSIVLDQQSAQTLAAPPADGREIALTHPSVQTLQTLGTWQQLSAHEVGRLREAHVHDGPVSGIPGMLLDAHGSGTEQLGWIVPNHALRRSAYAVAAQCESVRIIDSAKVSHVKVTPACASVEYSHPASNQPASMHCLRAPLVVAADSRFSATRRQLGVGAQMTDFGRTVIVCRMQHEHSHLDIAHECFGYLRTLAILPLPDDPVTGAHQCSAVVTADTADATALMELSAEEFTRQVEQQFASRLGSMQLLGERHSYPLVATYAQRFAGKRFALLGDAAVGMHPVTAHGYNLGLASVEGLTKVLAHAHKNGLDLGSCAALGNYAAAHHRQAWPIFQGTNAVVKLFTDPRPIPRVLRQIVLQGANRLPPLKAAIVQQLTGKSMRPAGLGFARPHAPGK